MGVIEDWPFADGDGDFGRGRDPSTVADSFFDHTTSASSEQDRAEDNSARNAEEEEKSC